MKFFLDNMQKRELIASNWSAAKAKLDKHPEDKTIKAESGFIYIYIQK
jgi:hypothetical protein